MLLFCKLPFESISIDDDGNVWPSCCPDWVDFSFGNVLKDSWEEIWEGEKATLFRSSCLDGSLRFCDKNWCPHIADAQDGVDNYHVVPYLAHHSETKVQPPKHVNLNYDFTCNLKCPSCRPGLIHIKGDEFDKIQKLHQFVELNILPIVESVSLTGVGDPFMSKIFRNFLFEFDSLKYPKLKKIHFHTNGILFDEELFNKMKGIHSLDISMDISIDAASEKVYQKVRPPGNWNTLMKNLDYIKTIDNISEVGISMVVQQENYHEMHEFIELGAKQIVANRNVYVEFKRLRHWIYTISLSQYKIIGLEFLSPSKKIDFIEVIESVDKRRKEHETYHLLPQIRHNLQEALPQKSESTKDDFIFNRILNKIRN
jgi:MoaA/NifB/PqqE/SkfB family radical SAM enzyme